MHAKETINRFKSETANDVHSLKCEDNDCGNPNKKTPQISFPDGSLNYKVSNYCCENFKHQIENWIVQRIDLFTS